MVEKTMSNKRKLNEVYKSLLDCTAYYRDSLPLCAAENVISSFCKIPLEGDFQERYIMGNTYSYEQEENFIGSHTLLPFYQYIHDECNKMFGAHYSDARTLSGMNCLTTLLMSLTNLNDKIAILPAEWGGHPSVRIVCERLGLQVYDLPYDHKNWDLDYDKANELMKQEGIDYVLLAPSDIIHPLAVENLSLMDHTLLYDISQIMGLIAGGVIPCPINLENTILFGGTHKTLPGPASGLIMTNSEELHKKIEHNINPNYLRHTQMHQVISLLFALLETDYFGSAYSNAIVSCANALGYYLEKEGFVLGKTQSKYSETHQLFIFCNRDEMNRIYRNAIRYSVTLNKKEKLLFNGTGIRLGTQEIARYGWDSDALYNIGKILKELSLDNPDEDVIYRLKSSLPKKEIYFTFPKSMYDDFRSQLHQE